MENIDYVICPICQKRFKQLGYHLKKHNLTKKRYIELYPNQKLTCEKVLIKRGNKLKGKLKGTKQSQETCNKKSKSMIGKFKGRISPNKGKHRTEETKRKISKSLKGVIFSSKRNEKISKANTGRKQSEETCKKRSESNKISHGTPEMREKHSIIATNMVINWTYKHKLYKHGYFYSKLNNKNYFYRSSYELQAYKLLDDEDSKSIIKSWKPGDFCLKYRCLNNGKIKRYVPDILVEYKSGKKQMIEVKPVINLKTNYNHCLEKAKAGEKFCQKNNMVYSIWTEKELNI